MPTRNDPGVEFVDAAQRRLRGPHKRAVRPEENFDNAARWGQWPLCEPDDFCGEFEPRTPGVDLRRPD